MQETLTLYGKVSSARVNLVKSEALFVGEWRNHAVPSLPEGLEWGIKVQGVFLSRRAFTEKKV